MKHKYHSGNGPRDDFQINPHSEAHQQMPDLSEFVIPQDPGETKEDFLDRMEKDFPSLREEIRAEREQDEIERREKPPKERDEPSEPQPPKPAEPPKPKTVSAGTRPKIFDVETNPAHRIVRGKPRKPSDIKFAK